MVAHRGSLIIVALIAALGACEGESETPATPAASEAPGATTPSATAPPATAPPATTPTATAPPAATSADAAPAKPPEPEGWKVGDRVQAKWTNGRWYPGKIVKVLPNGTYNVNYDDGDKSKGLPASKIRARPAAKPKSTSRKASKSSDAPCSGVGMMRRCNGVCVNIQSNNNHCGGCGNRCRSGYTCDGHMFCRDADGNL